MADLSITAANCISGSGARIEHGTAGETVTAGKLVYLDQTTTGKWLLADADAATAAARGQGKIGVALNGAALNQPLAVQTEGPITIGATVVAGTSYFLSPTPGGIAPLADILAGDYVTLVGIATSTSVIKLDFQYSGVSL